MLNLVAASELAFPFQHVDEFLLAMNLQLLIHATLVGVNRALR